MNQLSQPGREPHPSGGGAWLAELYARAEREAVSTIERYATGGRWKRRASRLLRGGVFAGAAAGAILPLAGVDGSYGYASLLVAAVCLGCDRYFGVTSGWVRNEATAQAVRRRVEALRYEWAAERVRDPHEPRDVRDLREHRVARADREDRMDRGDRGDRGDREDNEAEALAEREAAERRLLVLRRFSEDVADLVRAESAARMAESGLGPGLMVHAAGSGGTGPAARGLEAPAPSAPALSRPPAHPALRPVMPRQRPLEGPR